MPRSSSSVLRPAPAGRSRPSCRVFARTARAHTSLTQASIEPKKPQLTAHCLCKRRMNKELSGFDAVHPVGVTATRPLARLLVRLPLYPQALEGHNGQAGFVKPLKRQRLRSRATLAGPGPAASLLRPKGLRSTTGQSTSGIVCGRHPIRRTLGRVQLRFLG